MYLDRRNFLRAGAVAAAAHLVACGTRTGSAPQPRAAGAPPFEKCDNQLTLAEQLGVGTADLARIEIRGATLEQSHYSYAL